MNEAAAHAATARFRVLCLATTVLSFAACGGAGRAAPGPASAVPADGSPGARDAEGRAGAERLEDGCGHRVREVVNGLDDDCNGQIDEGFVGSGAIQVTLFWETHADLDLYVLGPGNQELSYQNREVPTGGVLDRDARGTCVSRENETTENVYWRTEQPPPGHYQVVVDYFDACDGAGPTPMVLSISVGGKIIGSYRYTLTPEDRRLTMATFQVP